MVALSTVTVVLFFRSWLFFSLCDSFSYSSKGIFTLNFIHFHHGRHSSLLEEREMWKLDARL